jgi:hypothetical protein
MNAIGLDIHQVCALIGLCTIMGLIGLALGLALASYNRAWRLPE